MDRELVGQLVDGKAVKVAGYQPFCLGWAQTSMDLLESGWRAEHLLQIAPISQFSQLKGGLT